MSNKKNILITGANGQLGMELRALEKKYHGYCFFFSSRDELSVTDTTAVEKYFSRHSFSYCIHCAAYTAVDKAEAEQEAAFELNAAAAGNLAAVCKRYGTALVHVSTDYVFDGSNDIPYNESDQTSPVNIYGASKLRGEKDVLENNEDAIIIRTSWVYSSHGKNFVKTMLRLMNEKENISVVNDQFGSPTYAADLADAILIIISDKKWTAGIYHYCNEGIISWYDFALEIKRVSNVPCLVNPIQTAAYPTPAKRPRYSALETTKIRQTFGLAIPEWKDSLRKCIALLGY